MGKPLFDSKKKRELQKGRYVLTAMVKRNVRSKYRNSALGVIWTVLRPLLEMLVYWFVFGQIFGNGDPIYHLYLLGGLLPFEIMAYATSTSLTSIVHNQGMMQQTKLNYEVFPMANTLSAVVNFFFSFVAMLLIAVVTQIVLYATGAGAVILSAYMLLIVVWLPPLMLFSYGLSLLLAALFVFFRDVQHIYGIFLMLWRFITPVFYKTTSYQEGSLILTIVNLNPMTQFVNFFRDIMIYNMLPDWTNFLAIYGWAIFMLVIGIGVFKSMKNKFVLYV